MTSPTRTVQIKIVYIDDFDDNLFVSFECVDTQLVVSQQLFNVFHTLSNIKVNTIRVPLLTLAEVSMIASTLEYTGTYVKRYPNKHFFTVVRIIRED